MDDELPSQTQERTNVLIMKKREEAEGENNTFTGADRVPGCL